MERSIQTEKRSDTDSSSTIDQDHQTAASNGDGSYTASNVGLRDFEFNGLGTRDEQETRLTPPSGRAEAEGMDQWKRCISTVT